jgi:histidyl-tRNA synthetase
MELRPGPISGFTNFDAKEHYLFTSWLAKTEAIFKQFGFTPFHPRPFERLEHLHKKGGMHKQVFGVYRIDGDQPTGLGLPFDHTLPFALFLAQYANTTPFPYKRYDLGLSYRGEHAQTGRFRAFVQADVDIAGPELGLIADVEVLSALTQALTLLEIGEFEVLVNHIGIVKAILAHYSIDPAVEPELLRIIDKQDKLSLDQIIKEVDQLLKGKVDAADLVSKFTFKGPIESFTFDRDYGPLADKAFAELKEAFSYFPLCGLSPKLFKFSTGMVRGLDYYTGIVFETYLVGKTHFGSIASGGRYSNLVGEFSAKESNIEGVGGSIGLTRLFDILNKSGELALKRTSSAAIVVGYRTEEEKKAAYELSARLREEGFNVDTYSGGKKVKHQLAYVDATGIPYAMIVMSENSIVVKEMASSTQADVASIDLALAEIKRMVKDRNTKAQRYKE